MADEKPFEFLTPVHHDDTEEPEEVNPLNPFPPGTDEYDEYERQAAVVEQAAEAAEQPGRGQDPPHPGKTAQRRAGSARKAKTEDTAAGAAAILAHANMSARFAAGIYEDGPPRMGDVPELARNPEDPPLPDVRRRWQAIDRPAKIEDITLPSDIVPPGSWIRYYIDWAHDQTDAPLPFHWAAAVGVLAAAMGPRWRIQHGSDWLLPRVYMLVVGTSGSRKTASLRMCAKLLMPRLVEMVQYGSEQAFVAALEEAPYKLWLLHEGAALFRGLGGTYSQSMAQKLCQLYDGDAVTIQSLSGGKRTVEEHFLGLLTASTEAGIAPTTGTKNPLRELVETGLMGRVWTVASGAKAVEYDDLRPGDERMQEWLARALLQISTMVETRTVEMSHGAYEELRMWLRAFPSEAPTPTLEGVWERRSIHAKKLAMIYQASLGAEAGTQISRETMLYAINAFHQLVIPSHRFVLESIGANETEQLARKLKRLLREEGSLLWSELPPRLGIPKPRVVEVVASMADDVHWEYWKKLPRDKGRSRIVLVLGAKPLPVDGRPNEWRTDDAADPPKAVISALEANEALDMVDRQLLEGQR
jgi:hypothetical protein